MCQVLWHYTAVFLFISLITTVHFVGTTIKKGKQYVHKIMTYFTVFKCKDPVLQVLWLLCHLVFSKEIAHYVHYFMSTDVYLVLQITSDRLKYATMIVDFNYIFQFY